MSPQGAGQEICLRDIFWVASSAWPSGTWATKSCGLLLLKIKIFSLLNGFAKNVLTLICGINPIHVFKNSDERICAPTPS